MAPRAAAPEIRVGREVEIGMGGCRRPPAPESAFPAFLLEVGPYARLNATIGLAQSQLELDPLTRDELQHFVDHFRGWLDAAGNDLRALLPEKVALVE